MWGAHEHYYSTSVDIWKFDTPEEILERYPALEKLEYAEITEEELKKYVSLKKAIKGEGCIKFNEDSWYLKVHPDEWERTYEFIKVKRKNGHVQFFKVGEKY